MILRRVIGEIRRTLISSTTSRHTPDQTRSRRCCIVYSISTVPIDSCIFCVRSLPSLIAPLMFEVSQQIEFCYGHRLLNYDGKCRHLHGHNGKAVIVLRGEQLDSRGMLVDFSDIKKSVRTWIDNQLDHRMILCEDDPVVPFLKQQGEPLLLLKENPTAENIAKLIFEYTRDQGFPVVEVRLWETPNAFATYRT